MKLILLLLLIVISSFCKKEEVTKPHVVKNYIHIAHTRTKDNPYADNLIEQIDFKKFDMLWLGGDLAYSTSQDDYTMSHLDSIFNFKDSNTLWSLGNHDYIDLNRIQNYTGRPPYYSYQKNGIVFIILDTQDSLSNIVGKQKLFFDSIVDTLQHASHLVILHHKLIWMYGNPDLDSSISTISNGNFGDCFYCVNPNNFYSDIYPKLLKIKKRGINVICIAGDIGVYVKEVEYETKEHIWFLASGIDSRYEGNKALIFHHDITAQKLTWEYKLISTLKKKSRK